LKEHFKIGAMLHEARLEKGMTQEDLAEKVGTTKSYISKIENNIKEVRLILMFCHTQMQIKNFDRVEGKSGRCIPSIAEYRLPG
jgi:DNA-binding XRE family transcriptional regulator